MQFLQYEGQNHNFSVGCYQLLQSSLPRQLLELVQQKPIGTFKFKFWWYTHLTESEPGNYQYFITERFYKKRGIGLCYSWKRSTEAGNIGSHFSKKKRIQKKKKNLCWFCARIHLLKHYLIVLMATHIWNCGRCWAGRASIKSNSLHAARYKVNHAGWLWAFSPFWELKTHEESKVERRFRCELEETEARLILSFAMRKSHEQTTLMSETKRKEKRKINKRL